MAITQVNPPNQKSRPSKLEIAMKVLDSVAALGSLGMKVGGMVGAGGEFGGGSDGLAGAVGRGADMQKMGLPAWYARFKM